MVLDRRLLDRDTNRSESIPDLTHPLVVEEGGQRGSHGFVKSRGRYLHGMLYALQVRYRYRADWNSIEAVRRAHSRLEGWALASFALLVLFDVWAHLTEDKDKDRARLFEKIGLVFFAVAALAEIAAYPYGQRNDKLSADMIGSLDEKAGEAEKKAKTALTDSATALTKAREATTKADAVGVEAGKAETAAGIALDKSDKATVQASHAMEDVTDARKLVLTTAAQLNNEHKIRMELENSLNPRLMYFLEFSDGTTNIDDLQSIKGKSVRFRFVPDAEAARAAINLAGLFSAAGWKIETILPIADVTAETLGQDGITVETYRPPKRELTSADWSIALADHSAVGQSRATTDAVSKWLRENGWESQAGDAEAGEITPDSILVRVGLKPYPFFEDSRYKKVMDEDNKRRNIDPNRYKDKTVVHRTLTVGKRTIFSGPADHSEQEK
jgi:hypothetical protein